MSCFFKRYTLPPRGRRPAAGAYSATMGSGRMMRTPFWTENCGSGFAGLRAATTIGFGAAN